ncbi:MAG TPA: SDR family NAD(P)-dependent oxidoreductase, partial [Thermoanaerobaculia bacterium]|nr:SDR family NAD(P)-dependent oxidoreductase [Thermoanaerobaculia bacterium]
AELEPRPPRLPWVSSLTGDWVDASDVCDRGYWVRHLRQTVRFGEAVGKLLARGGTALLEVGPGRTLASLVRRHPARQARQVVLSSLPGGPRQDGELEGLLRAVGEIWLAGVEVDWESFRRGERRRRVPLPTYPFERRRYWLDARPAAPGRGAEDGSGAELEAAPEARGRERQERDRLAADPADWFHVPVWKRAPWPRADAGRLVAAPWLVLADAGGLGERLARRLEEAGATVTLVTAGERFARTGPGRFAIAPANDADPAALVSALAAAGRLPRRIIHLFCLDAGGAGQAVAVGFHGVLALARALGGRGSEQPVALTVAASGVHEVTGDEALAPERAVLLGPVKVLPREMPWLACRAVDLPDLAGLAAAGGERRLARLVDALLSEAMAPAGGDGDTTGAAGSTGGGGDRGGAGALEPVVAYRGAHRWVQRFEPLRLPSADPAPPWKQRGVYLVTGGLGGIGMAIAERLARRFRARLVLTGRSALPPREAWPSWLAAHGEGDATSRRMRQVERLEALGSEVLVAAADVADRAAMGAVRDLARERFGRIDGVLHAAGIPAAGLIGAHGRETAAAALHAKVAGTLALAEITRGLPLDFVALFSSLTALLSQPGQADYTAGNAFLDAFAHAQAAAGGPPTVAVNWDAWQEVGMAAEAALPSGLGKLQQETLRRGLSPDEGFEALSRVLAARLPQVAVCKGDLQADVEVSFRERSLARLAAAVRAEAQAPAHPRPALATAYAAPRDAEERAVAGLWQELLGVEGVGIHDDFFELGGHSLLAAQLMVRLRADLHVELPLERLFAAPTVAGVAAAIAAARRGAAGRETAHEPPPLEAPLSFAQERLWFLDRLEPGSVAYNMPGAVRLSGPLEVSFLAASLRALVERHESLRTTFHDGALEPVQAVAPVSAAVAA